MVRPPRLIEFPSDFPYSFTNHRQRAVKKTVYLPLRIYSEPDIDWWLNERDFDLSVAGLNRIVKLELKARLSIFDSIK